MVIGNVLPGDSYHSCLSETGTLMACGDGCLKFSGEVCGWLRLCRPEITSATGCVPEDRSQDGCGGTYLATVGISFTEKGEVILKCTGQLKEYPGEYTVMKSECAQILVRRE